jgi:cyclic pyranopterin phosphate synthase
MALSPVLDTYRRPLRNLRLSVTDRCNLRCAYCMPEQEYTWLEREHILRFEEIVALVRVFASLGVDRLRLTGGEPLLRRDLPTLVGLVREIRGIGDLALTTNGVLLGEQARPLFEAGLSRLTVSLDTLQPDRFRALTRRDAHAEVLAGIRAARDAGFTGTKLDAVVMRGTNDDELFALLEYAREVEAELRYIEYMDVGGATRWSAERVVTRGEILRSLEARYGPIEPVEEANSAPAERFRLRDGTVFGIIASTTQPFCGTCDRSRLTADGIWYLCLYAQNGLDLRRALREGASDVELAALITSTWTGRTDRGAEERLSSRARTSLVSIEDLRADPHLEMHTRGG